MSPSLPQKAGTKAISKFRPQLTQSKHNHRQATLTSGTFSIIQSIQQVHLQSAKGKLVIIGHDMCHNLCLGRSTAKRESAFQSCSHTLDTFCSFHGRNRRAEQTRMRANERQFTMPCTAPLPEPFSTPSCSRESLTKKIQKTFIHHIQCIHLRKLNSFRQSKISPDTCPISPYSSYFMEHLGGFHSHWTVRFWCCSCTGKIGLSRRGSAQCSAEIAYTRHISKRWHKG